MVRKLSFVDDEASIAVIVVKLAFIPKSRSSNCHFSNADWRGRLARIQPTLSLIEPLSGVDS